jgi:glycosyltransferase involved in cell wall biosynthesis
MRIGIDARFFGPKDKGFGRYTENLIKSLEDLNTNHNTNSSESNANEFFIFLRKDSFNEYNPSNRNFHKILADYKWYGIKEQILFPLQLKKHKLDLMHFTHFNVPILYRRKFIVTIHDLILRYFPIRKGIKFWAYKMVFKHAIINSEKVIAISEYTKKDILKFYPAVNESKIEVIYEGIS